MVHRGGGKEKLWKFLALCAQQVCLYLLLGLLLQHSWQSSLVPTKPLSWAHVTKWCIIADPYPQSRGKLKLSLCHVLAHFLPAEALKHPPYPFHLKHNLAYFYLWWQGDISPPQVMLGWWEVCPPQLPVAGSGEQPVIAACGGKSMQGVDCSLCA